MTSHSRFDHWHGIPDREVWKAFQAGNWEALEYIYRTHTKNLFNYGMKIKPNASLVEDAIQELFVELWHSRERLTATEKIHFYLLKALKWKMGQHLKRERKLYGGQALEEISAMEVVLPFESKLVNDQLMVERKVQLQEGIKQLPDRQKEILQLLFFEELSYEEVASIMQIRVRSVYITAYRALSSLRKYLEVHGIRLLIHWAMYVLIVLQLLHII